MILFSLFIHPVNIIYTINYITYKKKRVESKNWLKRLFEIQFSILYEISFRVKPYSCNKMTRCTELVWMCDMKYSEGFTLKRYQPLHRSKCKDHNSVFTIFFSKMINSSKHVEWRKLRCQIHSRHSLWFSDTNRIHSTRNWWLEDFQQTNHKRKDNLLVLFLTLDVKTVFNTDS